MKRAEMHLDIPLRAREAGEGSGATPAAHDRVGGGT